jgi:hypothetical protein
MTSGPRAVADTAAAEHRSVPIRALETVDTEEEMVVEGYAAVFDRLSLDLGGSRSASLLEPSTRSSSDSPRSSCSGTMT